MSFSAALNAPPTKSAPKDASKGTMQLLQKAFTDRADLIQKLQRLAGQGIHSLTLTVLLALNPLQMNHS